MTCALDFVYRLPTDPANGIFDYVFQPDGNLATEFVAMEEVYQAEMARRSNDPFWCLLAEEGPPLANRPLFGDPYDRTGAGGPLTAFPSSRWWECLDIAGPTTLGALNKSALNYICPTPTADDTGQEHDCAWTFTALTDAQKGSGRLFGGTTQCDMKVVGDGTVNSLDIAVLLYAQFGEGPYDSIFLPGQTPGRFNPATSALPPAGTLTLCDSPPFYARIVLLFILHARC